MPLKYSELRNMGVFLRPLNFLPLSIFKWDIYYPLPLEDGL
ncbi:hypothetical protein PEDI_42770 [Persicobacter diffluens]|uniref:Uncharacterized protein n=1 Tax=Persicobacter diffluens TaxID=981 RepID=A0AAN4W473_9BACT|nr:hypothetical protein PEDI_42770 [Persicobacter diffluens]